MSGELIRRFIELLKEELALQDERLRVLQEFTASSRYTLTITKDLDQPLDEVVSSYETFSQAAAQKEMARLLERQPLYQAGIEALEREQKRAMFVGQQLHLIERLQKEGLNPEDILGGISIGLDASVDDLLEASRKTIRELLNEG